MALSSGDSNASGSFPTHYIKPTEGGHFTVETKQSGVWTTLTPAKPIRVVEGDMEGVGMWASKYKSGRYAGQSYHVLAVRLRDGEDLYQVNCHATSVAGTCLAAYLSQMSMTDRLYIGIIADEDDPKMVKLYVKKREDDDAMGELVKLPADDRKGLKSQDDRLAYCATKFGAATELKKFDTRPDENSATEEGGLTGFDEVQKALTAYGYPLLTGINLTVYSKVFEVFIKAIAGTAGVLPETHGPLEDAYHNDTYRVIAQGIRKIWQGNPAEKPKDRWSEPATLTEMRVSAGAVEEYDPFSDGSL